MLHTMSPLWLFLSLPMVLLLASAQPLNSPVRIIKNTGNWSDAYADIESKFSGGPSAYNFGRFYSPSAVYSGIPIPSGWGRNSMTGTGRKPTIGTGKPSTTGTGSNSTTGFQPAPELVPLASRIYALFQNLSRTSFPDGQGRVFAPGAKVTAEGLTWPTTGRFGYDVPSVNAPNKPELPSHSQEVSIPAPVTPVESKPLITPTAALRSPASSPESSPSIVIAGSTVKPVAPAITVSSTSFSLAVNGKLAAISDTTQKLISPTPPPVLAPLVFGGSTYNRNAASQFVVAGEILNPGSQVTVSGTPISLAAGGATAIVGSSTQILAPLTSGPQSAILTLAGSTYTADSSSFFYINSQILKPGGVVQAQGNAVSLDQKGTAVVIDGSSTQILGSAQSPLQSAIFTLAGSTYTADPFSHFYINSQTLLPGGVVRVQGNTVSLDQGGTAVVIGGSTTQTLSYASITGASRPAFVFNGTSVVQDAASDFIVDGQTLSKGGIVTISGTPISFAAEGTDVVVGTSTQALLGGAPGSKTGPPGGATGVAEFQSGADASHDVKRWYLGSGVGLLLLWNFSWTSFDLGVLCFILSQW